MDALTNIFKGSLPNVGPGGTPPILGGNDPGMPGVSTGGGGGTGGGGWLSKALPFLQLGMAGSGSIGNILANRSRNQVLSSEMDQMRKLQSLTPAQIIAGITSLERPLSSNLVNSVTNTVSGGLAERGLSQAPGIQASSIAQGIAPYQLQEQQLAQDAYFKKLGLPIQARPSPFGPFPATTNTNQLWQSIFQRYMPQLFQRNQVPANVANDTTGPDLIQQILQGNTPGLDFPSTQQGGG